MNPEKVRSSPVIPHGFRKNFPPGLILRFLLPGNLIALAIQEVLNIAATSPATVYTKTAVTLYINYINTTFISSRGALT